MSGCSKHQKKCMRFSKELLLSTSCKRQAQSCTVVPWRNVGTPLRDCHQTWLLTCWQGLLVDPGQAEDPLEAPEEVLLVVYPTVPAGAPGEVLEETGGLPA